MRARWSLVASALISTTLICTSQQVSAGFIQQGPKLVGTGVEANTGAGQGTSVALSADGDTAIVGGPFEWTSGTATGATWVFTRSGGLWSQQGSKLVGTAAATANISQGFSVSLSADGNTALVGGSGPNHRYGDTLVFTRSGGVWTQQDELYGTGTLGGSSQGYSVALSADGNTAIAGGPGDSVGSGATWVFTRSNGVWTQQGDKLIGTGTARRWPQGYSVALSADGNTAIVGGPDDDNYIGAAWVFTRSGGVWTQQGSKLVGTGAVGAARQGSSVALSADGNTAIVSGPWDNGEIGATWVFTRSGGVWTQQGSKLVGTGGSSTASQGTSVALSADGNTAIVGGDFDNLGSGATWVFTRSGGVWTQQGSKLVGTDRVQLRPPRPFGRGIRRRQYRHGGRTESEQRRWGGVGFRTAAATSSKRRFCQCPHHRGRPNVDREQRRQHKRDRRTQSLVQRRRQIGVVEIHRAG